MTHTNHRQGDRESLSNCFVVMMIPCQGQNVEGSAQKLHDFLQMASKYNIVNAGNMKLGNLKAVGSIEGLIADPALLKGSVVHAAFADEDEMVTFLTEIKEADMGLSVIISGLHDRAKECCERAGLHRHTVEYSLGIFGKEDVLPVPSTMEITTMCGHGQIAFNLVDRMVKDVTRGVVTMEEATDSLTKPCICGIVDPTRVRRLLEKLVAAALKPALKNYIAMDPSKCDKCYACEVACVEAHPDNGGHAMCIVDASMGPAISLHCLHCADAPCLKACSTGNIVRDADKDIVYMKGDRCIGCKLCANACPFGMIVWDEKQGKSHKCDLCIDKLNEGDVPACVSGCPTGALTSADNSQFDRKRQSALQATMASLFADEV